METLHRNIRIGRRYARRLQPYDLLYDHMKRQPSTKTRVTVTLPSELLDEIDLQVKNRSRFIAEAVQRELDRRREELLRKSLEAPHSESGEISGVGFEDWVKAGQHDSGLLDPNEGKEVRWSQGEGWVTIE
jgi:Arc/MetJ-type ribon-helix-helix transcriptional regulator